MQCKDDDLPRVLTDLEHVPKIPAHVIDGEEGVGGSVVKVSASKEQV